MGALSDLIIADRNEADAILSSPNPAKQWPAADVKGIDTIMASYLWAFVEGVEDEPAIDNLAIFVVSAQKARAAGKDLPLWMSL